MEGEYEASIDNEYVDGEAEEADADYNSGDSMDAIDRLEIEGTNMRQNDFIFPSYTNFELS